MTRSNSPGLGIGVLEAMYLLAISKVVSGGLTKSGVGSLKPKRMHWNHLRLAGFSF